MSSIMSFNQACQKSETSNGALYLTPYIERGDIEAGQKAALVEPLCGKIVSYSGLFTVDKRYNSNLFFWFFPAEEQSDTAPVVTWFQGGPGVPTFKAIFEEIGPFYLNKSLVLQPREHYWSKTYNVLFIDSPIGTGFSHTDSEEGYARTDASVGETLYKGMRQFFQLFPKYLKNDLYLGGACYGAKHVATLATAFKENKYKFDEEEKLNLKGLIIAGGFFDPINASIRTDLLYQLGVIDSNFVGVLDNYNNKIISLISEDKYLEAMEEAYEVRDVTFRQIGYTSTTNFLYNNARDTYGNFEKFIDDDFKGKIHVTNLKFNSDLKVVVDPLGNDIFRSVKELIESLIEDHRILLFHGQLGIEGTYASMIKFIKSMEWSGADKYKSASRKLWYVGDQLAGYIKTADNLTEVLVRNAGHRPAYDKPGSVLDLINRFTNNLI